MKMLIILERSPKKRYLVWLPTKGLIREVKMLIGRKKYAKAILMALINGKFEREIVDSELASLSADLILSEESASWDA